MSRIHQALQKARREGVVAPPRRLAQEDPPAPAGSGPAPRPGRVHHVPDRGLRPAILSSAALEVLSHSYEEIERICGMEGGPVLGLATQAVRVLLVGGAEPGLDAASAALALAATLAEKQKARVAVAEADFTGRGIGRLVEEGGPGMGDLLLETAGVERCLRRTELAGLYAVPAGTVPSGPDATDGEAAGRALRALLEYMDFLVVHVGPLPGDLRSAAWEEHADAVLLVGADPEAPPEDAGWRGRARVVPLRAIRESPYHP